MRNMTIVSFRKTSLWQEIALCCEWRCCVCQLTASAKRIEPPKSVTAPECFCTWQVLRTSQALPPTRALTPHELLPQNRKSYTSRRNPAPHRSTQAQKPGQASAWTPPTGCGPWLTISVAPNNSLEYASVCAAQARTGGGVHEAS